MRNEILLIPNKPDIERDKVAKAWLESGGEVLRIEKFWKKPVTNDKRVTLYGFDTFCLVLAQILDLELRMPKDEIIAGLPKAFVTRDLAIKTISESETITFPIFIKPVQPKLFVAKVFQSLTEFQTVITDLQSDVKLICSSIIKVEKEVRAFILENSIADLAFYEGDGDLNAAYIFIEDFLQKNTSNLPKTYVLDIGYNEKEGWFIIEFNSSWGAGLNGCSAEKVIKCIRIATVN